jgi:hypothetical protein
LVSFIFKILKNGYVYGVVWRFEARTCQTVHGLLDVTPLKLALSAKCTIHDVCALHEQQCTLVYVSFEMGKYKFYWLKEIYRVSDLPLVESST